MACPIRLLTPADAEAFWRLRLAGFRDDPEAFGSTAEDHAERPLGDVVRELGSSDDHFVLGAFDDEERLVGIVGLDREKRSKRRHRASVWGMYIDPSVRGRGVGAALVEALLARARVLEDLEQLNLTVMAGNGSARRLYERFGFQVFGTEPRAMRMGERAFDEHHMFLDLRHSVG